MLEEHGIGPRVVDAIAAARDHAAVWALEVYSSFVIPANPVTAFVHERMVVRAEQERILDARVAAVGPMTNVMRVDEPRAVGSFAGSDATSSPPVVGDGPPTYAEVIGVVPDLVINVNRTEPAVAYHPLPPDAAVALGGTTLVLRAAGDPDVAMQETVTTARALDPRVTLGSMLTFDEQIGRQMSPQRFGVYVLGTLGGIALLLTTLGTYVIADSMVVRRRRELSIRAALGAGGTQLRRLVLRDTARPIGIGLTAGLVLTVLGARMIRSLLYRVEPLDPILLVIVSTVILSLALIVSLRPAYQATRLDLTRSLRDE